MKSESTYPKSFSPRNTLFSNLVLKLTPEELAQWDEKDFRRVISSDVDILREELEDFLPYAVQEALRSEGDLTDVIRLYTATTLLGEVGDSISMDVMLDVLRQDPDFLDMCFGDDIFECMPLTYYKVGRQCPEKLGDFISEMAPKSYPASAVAISALFTIIYKEPSRKAEILEVVRKVARNLISTIKDKSQVSPDEFITSIFFFEDLVYVHASELLPEIKELCDLGYTPHNDSYEHIERDMKDLNYQLSYMALDDEDSIPSLVEFIKYCQ